MWILETAQPSLLSLKGPSIVTKLQASLNLDPLPAKDCDIGRQSRLPLVYRKVRGWDEVAITLSLGCFL